MESTKPKRAHSSDHVGEAGDIKSAPSASLDAALGAAAGAATGAFAGPPGVIVGGIIGAAVGAAVGIATTEHAKVQAEVDEELDEEIGVEGGSMGAAKPNAPKARIGAYSAGSAGSGTLVGGANAPDEGPIPKAD